MSHGLCIMAGLSCVRIFISAKLIDMIIIFSVNGKLERTDPRNISGLFFFFTLNGNILLIYCREGKYKKKLSNGVKLVIYIKPATMISSWFKIKKCAPLSPSLPFIFLFFFFKKKVYIIEYLH